ncbi:acetylserotonin O-methyltransferase-like [Pituophis catenifer annectens]|uniref:acetylserotonin O-methyltransferase-like n=1 Tax=Pituophis catenifer annectens TaxID=94852 RepID=UPI0039927350
MASPEEKENIKILFQHQHSFMVTKIIFTSCEFGIFDLLRESGESLSSVIIAERLNTSLAGMEMLLNCCVTLNLLKMERKDDRGLYENTEFANLYLAKSSPKSQYYTLKFFSDIVYPGMKYLPDAVREGKNQISSITGVSSNNVFEAFYRSEENIKAIFRCMNEAWSLHGREVLTAFDLSEFEFIYDIGGSCGALSKELIAIYPNCTVTLFDLPEVVETSKKYHGFSEASRITLHGGDFFKDPIPEADLYIFARILFDWNDEKCLQLLNKVFNVCKPGGGVLIVEPTLDKDKTLPFPIAMYSLIVLLNTEGKVRTPSEYHSFLSSAGFKDIQLKKGNLFDVILARK